MQAVADLLQRDALDDLVQEALHDQPLGLGALQAAAAEVEELVPVDLAHRRAVRAAHVVGPDLQLRHRVDARLVAEQQVAVRLVGVGLLRARLDADQPGEDLPRAVAQHAFEEQVAGCVRLEVVL